MLVSTLFAFLAILQPISCWGSLGHRTVAYLAQKYLTADASRFVDNLLANDRGLDISDAALFADGSVRQTRPYTKQWHYIDALDDPPRHCEVKYQRDCNNHGVPGCVVSAITNMTHVIRDSSNPFIDRKEALMFLIHFVGDIHQPLHTENASRGGTQLFVDFDGDNDDLHAIWDTQMLLKYRGLPRNLTSDRNKEKQAAAKWANELYHSEQDRNLRECNDISDPQTCALEWASEANSRICTHVLKPGVDWLKHHDLGGDYYRATVPVMVDLVRKAGLRLGGWINALTAAQSSEGNLIVQGAGRDRESLQDPEL